MTMHTHLIVIWATITVLSLLAVVAVLIWAVRTRQLSRQDRARYLPLHDLTPPEQTIGTPEDSKGETASESDEAGKDAHVPD